MALLIGAIILAIAIYFFFRFMKSSDKKLKLLIDPKTKNSIVLIDRENLSEDSRKFRFGLPSVNHILGLPVGQHVKISTTLDGNIVSRSYTPVTSDDDHGLMEFIIKIYFANVHPKFPNGGKMTQYLECMKIGDMINISGPYGNLIYEGKGKFLIKETYGSPFVSRIYSKVGMIAGGTGIAPMLQIIRHVFKNPGDPLQIWLLYANRLEKDILMRQELENINNGYSDRFRLWYTLDQSSNNDWSYR